MKKIITIITLMFTTVISNAQTIPNAGFENWTNHGNYDDPDSFVCYNSFYASTGVFTVEKGTPGATGASYLKLTNKAVNVGGISPGFISLGGGFTPGAAFTARPQFFTGQFQCNITVLDTANIYIFLSKWNSVTMSREWVGGAGKMFVATTVTSWTAFNVPFVYFNGDTPDSLILYMSAANGPANIELNNYLYIDNLGTSGNVPAGIAETEKTNLSIAPNPFSSQTILSFSSEQKNTSLKITDILGKEIKTFSFSGKELIIEKEEMKEGIYFLQITDENKSVITKKIVIQ